MKIISLYLKERKYWYVFLDNNGNSEKGEIDENNIEKFLKEKNPKIVHLTVSKPLVLSRKLTLLSCILI